MQSGKSVATQRGLTDLVSHLRERFFTVSHGWWEVPLFMCVLFALMAGLSPDDPFGLAAQYPWPWLMVILLALRYGFVGALFASLCLLAAWLGWGVWNADLNQPFPAHYFIGGFAGAMLCGEFSDVWRSRLRRLEEARNYVDARLGRLTREHYLLRLSHERLEQEFVSRPVTLRDAIQRIRDLAQISWKPGEMPGASTLLHLLAQYCQLEVAALYLAPGGNVELPAIARLGEAGGLDVHDRLVRHALERKVLAHLQTGDYEDGLVMPYLVVAPIMTSDKEIIGLLVVEQMPFFALQQDVLQMLLVLLEYYADSVSVSERLDGVIRTMAQTPDQFCAELLRLSQMNHRHGLESRLTMLAFPQVAETEDVVAQLRRQRRGLDLAWETRVEGRPVYVTLMPLANENAVNGYLDRVGEILQERVGQDLLTFGVHVESRSLNTADPASLMQEMMGRCVYRT